MGSFGLPRGDIHMYILYIHVHVYMIVLYPHPAYLFTSPCPALLHSNSHITTSLYIVTQLDRHMYVYIYHIYTTSRYFAIVY